MAKITMTLGQFLAMGEAQSKILLANGYAIEIADSVRETLRVSNNTNAQPSKPSSKEEDKKPATNGRKTKKSKGKKTSNKTKTAPALKVNDYFKVVSTKGNKVVAIGQVKEIATDKITATNGRSYVPANCVVISQKTYGKLSQRKALKKFLENKPEVSEADKFKKACMFLLHKNGKLDDSAFKLSLDNAEKRSELYKEFKDYLKEHKKELNEFINAKPSAEQANA